jgi:hypothetical protein
MSLERKPAGRPGPENALPTRTLAVSSNPAQRLQELLRREAEQAREAQEIPEPISPPEAIPDFIPEAIVAPPPPPAPADPAPAITPPVTDAPPPLDAALRRREDPVLLIVVVNSERNGPVEYASIEEMPTIVSLEETHRAFLLSDEWQRRGPTLTRVIRLRRRRR